MRRCCGRRSLGGFRAGERAHPVLVRLLRLLLGSSGSCGVASVDPPALQRGRSISFVGSRVTRVVEDEVEVVAVQVREAPAGRVGAWSGR